MAGIINGVRRNKTYRLVNVSDLPTRRVSQLVRFAWDHTPRAKSDLVIVAGPATPDVGTYEKTDDGALITLYPRVTKVFPHTYKYAEYKTAPRYRINTIWEEVLLAAAHEFHHSAEIAQGLRGSEIRAEHHSLEVLRKYREGI